MCFNFLYDLWDISHSKKKWERETIKMYIGLHVKYRYSCPILMKFEFSRQISEKYSNIKFHEHPSSWSRVIPYGQQTWRSYSTWQTPWRHSGTQAGLLPRRTEFDPRSVNVGCVVKNAALWISSGCAAFPLSVSIYQRPIFKLNSCTVVAIWS